MVIISMADEIIFQTVILDVIQIVECWTIFFFMLMDKFSAPKVHKLIT